MVEKPFAYPSKEAFAEMLKTLHHDELVARYLLTREMPFAFMERKSGYAYLIGQIAKSLGTTVESVTLIGSGRIGFSLDPFKFGVPFSRRSDLDFAIVDSVLFDRAWLELVGLGAGFARLDREVQRWVNEHRTNNVYWGYMEPDNLRNAVSCYRVWFPLFAGLAQYTSFAERGISGRLYRTWDHVRSHQLYSLAKIRRTLG
jgi:hypothetical protein